MHTHVLTNSSFVLCSILIRSRLCWISVKKLSEIFSMHTPQFDDSTAYQNNHNYSAPDYTSWIHFSLRYILMLIGIILCMLFLCIHGKENRWSYADENELHTSFTCPEPPNTNELVQIIHRTDIILAGRIRERYKIPGQKLVFNARILPTNIYKTNQKINGDIVVGPLFLPSSKKIPNNGCLSTFHPNAKYIFFLKNNLSNLMTYQPAFQAIGFSEKIEKLIYTDQCQSCGEFMSFFPTFFRSFGPNEGIFICSFNLSM